MGMGVRSSSAREASRIGRVATPSAAAVIPVLTIAVPEPTPDAIAPQPRAAAIDVPWKTSIAVANPRPRTQPGSTLWMTEKTVENAVICPAPLRAAPTMSIARFVAAPTRTSSPYSPALTPISFLATRGSSAANAVAGMAIAETRTRRRSRFTRFDT